MDHSTSSERLTTSDGLQLAVYRHERTDGPRVQDGADARASRPTIVAVHGYPDNAGVWNALVPHLLETADVVTYDVRGTGDSDEPTERSAYCLSQLVADLDAVVTWTSEHSEGPVHLLAHHWGSIQAWQAVTDSGSTSRVASFTSLSGPCLDHVERWIRAGLRRGSDHRRATFRQLASSSYIAFFKVRGLAEIAGATGILARVMRSATNTGAEVPGFRRRRRDIVNGLELYRQNMLTSGGARSDSGPRTTAVPVQIITPLQDAYVRPPMASSATEFVPDVTVRAIDADHWAITSHPAEVADLVVGFLGEQQAA